MAYVDIDLFLPEVLQYVNGVPSIMARIHIRNAIILFCERTFILKKSPTNISLLDSTSTYTMSYTDDRYVAVALEEVRIGSSDDDPPLTRTTEKEMTEEFGNWRQHENSEPTRVWLKDDINEIRFWPTPKDNIDDAATLITVVRPKRDQTEFDELILEKWGEAITAGALVDLLLIPGASWFNPKLAAAFERKFTRWVQRARKTTINAPGKYPGRVIPQDFTTGGGDTNSNTISWL